MTIQRRSTAIIRQQAIRSQRDIELQRRAYALHLEAERSALRSIQVTLFNAERQTEENARLEAIKDKDSSVHIHFRRFISAGPILDQIYIYLSEGIHGIQRHWSKSETKTFITCIETCMWAYIFEYLGTAEIQRWILGCANPFYGRRDVRQFLEFMYIPWIFGGYRITKDALTTPISAKRLRRRFYAESPSKKIAIDFSEDKIAIDPGYQFPRTILKRVDQRIVQFSLVEFFPYGIETESPIKNVGTRVPLSPKPSADDSALSHPFMMAEYIYPPKRLCTKTEPFHPRLERVLVCFCRQPHIKRVIAYHHDDCGVFTHGDEQVYSCQFGHRRIMMRQFVHNIYEHSRIKYRHLCYVPFFLRFFLFDHIHGGEIDRGYLQPVVDEEKDEVVTKFHYTLLHLPPGAFNNHPPLSRDTEPKPFKYTITNH